ncbi:MAG: hypothetical protein ACE5EB_00970 [Thermodesulfobacteriota bacterium]
MFFSLMHIVHVIAVVLWIGGLAFITFLLLPMIIRMKDPLQKVLLFQRIEHRFAPLARVYNIITGISGVIMVLTMGWQRIIFTRAGLPLLVMSAVWVMWFVMLFGLEPLIVRRMLDNMARGGTNMDIEGVFNRMNRMHWVLVIVSIVAIISGSVFAHGPLFF